ncbi:hypothetical protein [Vibrio sp. THAF190c]|uniref:hypothetical protein n=1 Tax=Vibrio sp. THAF190c TaxID=2587865 RepID=UPI001268262F|nr:hypothetical protein [Vibrio sp. THAF190c]QFT13529.1 hypothetical protein FIV04_26600 [Vibrio sp. THAF190c]
MKKQNHRALIAFVAGVVANNPALANEEVDTCSKALEIEQRTTKSYYLSHDIDCSGYTLTAPIKFNGILDGKGYAIRNLTIDANSRYSGFFSEMDGATVNNLTFENITLKVGSNVNAAGILAGDIQSSRLENVIITHSQIQATGETVPQGIGIVAGRFRNQSDALGINVLHSNLWVEKSSHVGSIFGYAANSNMSSLITSNNQLIVEGDNRTNFGGLVGYLTDASLFDIESTDNLLSAPMVEKGNMGMISGYIVTGQIVDATIARHIFDTQAQTNHLRLAIISGYIDDPKDSPESPSLQGIAYYGDSSLDWFNSKDVVYTDNLTKVE